MKVESTETIPDPPSLREGVECFEAQTPDAPWVARGADNNYFRVGGDLAKLIRTIDGQRSITEISDELSGGWTDQIVRSGILELSRKGMIDDGTRHRQNRGWFRFRPPLTFQFTIFKPDRFLGLLAPLVRFAWSPITLFTGIAVVVGGLVALAFQGADIVRVGGEPLAPSVIVWVFVASQLTTFVHELAHGAVLTHYGGRPTRLGVMLFYLMPAMFCDVSDGWRLPHGRQRVHIALAGPVVQVVAANLAALASVFVDGNLHSALIIYSIISMIAGVTNLIPFVKLDGYIALMSYLDIPNLRDRSMADAKSALTSFLFGASLPKKSVDKSWSVPYGLVCMVFPIWIVFLGFSIWSSFFLSMGLPGAIVLVLLLGYIVWKVSSGLVGSIRSALSRSASPLRIAFVALLLTAGVGYALATITVSNTYHGRFAIYEDEAWLLVNHEANLERISGDHVVILKRRGALFAEERGEGTASTTDSETVEVPLRALVTEPGPGEELLVSTLAVPLVVTTDPEISAGAAEIDLGQTSLASWLYRNIILPVSPF